jgi:hypothetical protein
MLAVQRFMVVPFVGGLWKTLDLKLSRYVRAHDSAPAAERYARIRNRRVGCPAQGRKYRRCATCDSAPCACGAESYQKPGSKMR